MSLSDITEIAYWKERLSLDTVNQFFELCREQGADFEQLITGFESSRTREEHLWKWLDFLLHQVRYRYLCDPDIIIGRSDESPEYLRRWYLVPRNPLFNAYLHEFLRDDHDEALHDHPWHSLSLVLAGDAYEYQPDNVKIPVKAGDVILRPCPFPHRIELHGQPMITLFLTGPIQREWGFLCPQGWKVWHEFLGGKDNYGGKKAYQGCAD